MAMRARTIAFSAEQTEIDQRFAAGRQDQPRCF